MPTHSCNSIVSSFYRCERDILDGKHPLRWNNDKELKKIIAALFISIKDKRYRNKGLVILVKIIDIISHELFLAILSSDNLNIDSKDINTKKRCNIINFLFDKIDNSSLNFAACVLIGFYAAPDILPIVKKHLQSNMSSVRLEAENLMRFLN